MGADKRMRRCRLSAYRLSIRCADADLRPGGLRQDHTTRRVGLSFRIGDRIAHRKTHNLPKLSSPHRLDESARVFFECRAAARATPRILRPPAAVEVKKAGRCAFVQKPVLGYNQGESPSTATLMKSPVQENPWVELVETARRDTSTSSVQVCVGLREYVKKGNNPMAMTFEQVIEMIRQFPDEQQEMLVDLIRGWRTETRRREIARDARESLAAFRSGQLEPQSAQAVITELQQSLEDQE